MLDQLEEKETTTVRKRFNFRKLLWIAGAAAIVVIAVLWFYFSKRESTDDAQIDGHVIPISAKVGGSIIRVDVQENTFVEKGTLIAEIDPKDYQVAVKRAEGDLAEAQADAAAARNEASVTSANSRSELTSAQANVAATAAQVSAAEAGVRQAEANAEKAAKDLDRLKPLLEKDEIAQRDYDAAATTAKTQRAAVDAARASLNQMRQQLGESKASLTAARTAPEQQAQKQAEALSKEARVQQMFAALEQAKLNLQYTQILAPVSGWVSKKNAEPGQIIQPSQPLMSIVPLTDIWVTANFKETQLRYMHPGQHAKIHVDAYGRDFDGHVESISPATGGRFSLLPPENATGNFVKVVQRIPVRIAFERGQDPKHLLRPGMSTTVTILVK